MVGGILEHQRICHRERGFADVVYNWAPREDSWPCFSQCHVEDVSGVWGTEVIVTSHPVLTIRAVFISLTSNSCPIEIHQVYPLSQILLEFSWKGSQGIGQCLAWGPPICLSAFFKRCDFAGFVSGYCGGLQLSWYSASPFLRPWFSARKLITSFGLGLSCCPRWRSLHILP